MKLPLTQPIDPVTLQARLATALPHYEFSMRGKHVVVAKKTAAVGATVLVRKNKLVVNGNFPNMGLQLVFVLSVVFLGVLLPLIVFFLTVHRGQRAAEKEVGAALEGLLSAAHPPAQAGFAHASV